MVEKLSWLERPPVGHSPTMLHTHEVTGSSPVVSTTYEKSELLPCWDGFGFFVYI